MYINAATNSIVLWLYRLHFYNIICKIKYKLHTTSGSMPPVKNSLYVPVPWRNRAVNSTWTAWTWRWRRYYLLKHWRL